MSVVRTYRRQTTRLAQRNYDEGGYYFITTCTHNRECCLGTIQRGEFLPSALGKLAKQKWLSIPFHHVGVELDEFVIMPNHVHGILLLPHKEWQTNPKRLNQFVSPVAGTLGSIVRSYKASVSKAAAEIGYSFAWQRRYWDHVIRHNQALLSIREYIWQNPLNWAWDSCNPAVSHLYEPERRAESRIGLKESAA